VIDPRSDFGFHRRVGGIRGIALVALVLAGCSDGYVVRLVPETAPTTRRLYVGVRPILEDVPLPRAHDAGVTHEGVTIGDSLCGPEAGAEAAFVGADIREGGDHVEVLCAP
jgi:hypothetical protein